MKSDDWLINKRKVRFGDCDSAGVIHFHNLLRWSHEAWEESLEKYGIMYDEIFPVSTSKCKVVFPIVNCEAKFYLPIKLGHDLQVKILPTKIKSNVFKVETIFLKEEIKYAECQLIHCAIDSNNRKKDKLPNSLELWIESSNLNNKISEC